MSVKSIGFLWGCKETFIDQQLEFEKINYKYALYYEKKMYSLGYSTTGGFSITFRKTKSGFKIIQIRLSYSC